MEKVIRGGRENEIEARDLVIGDIVSLTLLGGLVLMARNGAVQIVLEEGSTIPADATASIM